MIKPWLSTSSTRHSPGIRPARAPRVRSNWSPDPHRGNRRRGHRCNLTNDAVSALASCTEVLQLGRCRSSSSNRHPPLRRGQRGQSGGPSSTLAERHSSSISRRWKFVQGSADASRPACVAKARSRTSKRSVSGLQVTPSIGFFAREASSAQCSRMDSRSRISSARSSSVTRPSMHDREHDFRH